MEGVCGNAKNSMYLRCLQSTISFFYRQTDFNELLVDLDKSSPIANMKQKVWHEETRPHIEDAYRDKIMVNEVTSDNLGSKFSSKLYHYRMSRHG